jgi:hypothetical protein
MDGWRVEGYEIDGQGEARVGRRDAIGRFGRWVEYDG